MRKVFIFHENRKLFGEKSLLFITNIPHQYREILMNTLLKMSIISSLAAGGPVLDLNAACLLVENRSATNRIVRDIKLSDHSPCHSPRGLGWLVAS